MSTDARFMYDTCFELFSGPLNPKKRIGDECSGIVTGIIVSQLPQARSSRDTDRAELSDSD